MPTKNFKDFCPGSLLEGRAEILQILNLIEFNRSWQYFLIDK
jgi:hypothetical protein